MRILVLGKEYNSKSFYELFSQNAENIVFSTIKDTQGYIDFADIQDIIDFCQANEINLVLIIDEEYINMGLQELISNLGISAFAPSVDAINICSSKIYAKRFMYKNKIPSPKFQIAEKLQQASEYFKNTSILQVVKPDNKTYQESCVFCETYSQIQKAAQELFASGNKKIILEDYIEGKNISIWVLSDGYNAKIIGSSALYNDNVAYFNPSFLKEDIKEKIYNTIVMPTITALNEQEEEYIGILGFDIILTYNEKLFLIGYKSFFDNLNVDFYTKGYNVDWGKIFEDTIVGNVFINDEIDPCGDVMLSLRNKDEINFISAKTKTNLKLILNELDYDITEYKEAEKIWKY